MAAPAPAHLAIVAPPLAGHVNALSALALALIERGHRVTLLGPADAARWLSDPRVGFHAIARDTHPEGAMRADERRMGRLRGLLGVPRMIRDLAALTDAVCRDVPSAIEALGIDALIVDQLEPGGALAARIAGVPYASVATGLHVNREPAVPPPFVGWDYDPTERGEWKARGAYRVADRLMAPIGDVLERHARAHGLPPVRDGADLLSPLADILQCPRSLDFPRQALSGATHHVGPLRRPDPRAMPELDGLGGDRPLAFASLGTLQGAREGLLRRIARACAAEALDLVVVHCGLLDARRAARLGERPPGSGTTIVRDFVPQRAVLARADLAVVHGGFNTVLDALEARTRLVVMPLAFEQPAIAARVERAGVGRRLSAHASGTGTIRRAIRDVLDDEAMPGRLDAIARDIETAGGVERAADLVEAILSAEPVARERPRAGAA